MSKGHIIGLVGANGAGKTTIMKAILSLIKSEGQITIDGQKTTFNHHPILQKVGALVEYPGIYPYLSGRDHLKLFVNDSKDSQERIQTIINDLKLNDYIDQRAKLYSLGMKQKLGIAMALVNQPDLVILDEPMNGLDPQATKDLREMILKRRDQGLTVLISSHILGELQKLAEDLIVIDHGKVIKRTTMNELLASNQHFIVIKTSDDTKAQELLEVVGFKTVSQSPLRFALTEKNTVERLMNILMKQQINVTDLQHEDADLEESILQLIAE
ncbi:ATP-binding cassette domain-containing protein [Companilactobacillus zhachilii]|uniref:ATP-binding cassette domain-containing protein n=1 Tax=Companilactobacillus zhachilii TaxID=2304606 RepID=UPI00269BE142